jgi:hypothetical protein
LFARTFVEVKINKVISTVYRLIIILFAAMIFKIIYANVPANMLNSILLINLQELNDIQSNEASTNRRSAIPVNDSSNDPSSNAITLSNQLTGEDANIPLANSTENFSASFESTHLPPLETNLNLTNSFEAAFSIGGSPNFSELIESINNLSSNKTSFELSNPAFLSAMKSMISAYFRADGEYNSEYDLPLALYSIVLPNIENWEGSIHHWVKSLSQSAIEVFISEGRSTNEISSLASNFAQHTVNLIHYGSVSSDPLNLDYNAEDTNDITKISNLNSVTDQISLQEKLEDGTTYNSRIISIIQQLSVGLTQGFLGSLAFADSTEGLSFSDIESFTKLTDGSSFSSSGLIETNLISSFYDGLLTESDKLGNELFVYELINSSSNGFLLASTVATTSNPQYFDNNLHTKSAQNISQQITQSLILHKNTNEGGAENYSVDSDLIQPDRLIESAAKGAAMGSQLASVLPKSWEYTNSWEIFTNSRRDLAKAVSIGASYGAVNSSSWLSTIPSLTKDGETVLDSEDIESIAKGVSVGAMIGNTGLAVYYPTDQLVPIINFSAQGSSLGSLSSENISLVEPTTTESIDVSIARQSAIGSSMGAAFEPIVLLGLDPATSSNPLDTIDHLTAASFGATFGAILGIYNNSNYSAPSSVGPRDKTANLTQIKQATKQGSIEGAIAGISLALDIDQPTNDNLLSKASILKAINRANANASSNASSSTAASSFRTDPQDMLLLMKKFGINPRYTNPAKMYKRPVIVQVDEPPIDDESSDAISNASPL